MARIMAGRTHNSLQHGAIRIKKVTVERPFYTLARGCVMLRLFKMLTFILLALLALPGIGFVQAATINHTSNNPLAALHFRFLGPNGNRDISVVGVPGNPLVAYFGAASGGIWKTTDGGTHFKPIFDSTDVSAIGALALAPSNPDIVWAGTGEPYIIRQNISPGDGVYKSTDAGRTWQHMGLTKTGHIAHIAINPTNPNVVFVCAVGQAYKPNAERGVYRTEDGGQTWKLVLKVNKTTGCSGLSMDMHDPNTLFASTWQVTIRPWDLDSGGRDGGVFVTHDGGNTWSRLGASNGLPAKGTMLGKTAVRIAPSNDKVVYALMQGPKTGLLYRSNNGGKNWTLAHKGDELDLRAPYYTNFTVAPNNENLLYFPSTPLLVSTDGGRTIITDGGRAGTSPGSGAANGGKFNAYPGGDTHDVWIDPQNPNRIMTANDEGGDISLNGGESWFVVNLPIAQIYHVYTTNTIPYDVIGNRQDTDGEEGPSRVLTYSGDRAGTIPAAAWHAYHGCESGFGVPDPVDPNIIWTGCYNGDLTRTDVLTGQSRNVSVWPVATYGAPTSEVRNRWNWTFPIAISPFDHNHVYVGSQYVYKTTDAGQNWKRISPDLTTDKHLGSSGGLTIDNLMTFSSASLSIIDESPVKRGVIWTGSYDGQVNITRDGGQHWTNVTANIKGLPPWGDINLEASPFDAGTAYVTSDRMMMGDYKPYIYETTDYGRTWKDISGNIPHSEFSFVHIVREDPVRKGMLYAGTGNAIYVSWDDGSHWTHLRNNLPPAPMYWLTIQPTFSDLVIGTYGRGIWVLDDITPLRSWPEVSRADKPHLFTPRPAYRFRNVSTKRQSPPNGVIVGENIRYGADLNYYLPSPEPVTITVTNSAGKVVRVLKEHGKYGLNRVFWNLRYPPLSKATLLTPPPGKPWDKTSSKERPLTVWGAPAPAWGPLVLPGTFSVSLAVDGSPVGSAPLRVLHDPDPNLLGNGSTMAAGQALLLKISREIDQTVTLINYFEATRKQLDAITLRIEGRSNASKVRAAVQSLEAKAVSIESRLFYLRGGGSAEDSFRGSPQLYEKLGTLYNDLQVASFSGYNNGSAQGPTAAEIEVNKKLQRTLSAVQQATAVFKQKAVMAFNADAKKNGLDVAIQ